MTTLLYILLFQIALANQTLLSDSIPSDTLTLDSIRSDSVMVDSVMVENILLPTDTLACATGIGEAPLPDSVYIERLQALPCVVELPYNEVVRAFILRYVQRAPKQLARLQRKAEYYFPLFDDIFARYDMPYEIKYLAVIESALNPQARSKMGAAGLWQFMPSTGKLYGLEINSLIDERMDPVKSTEAACRYLTYLKQSLGDWTLALAAYNCGSGNVRKAIARSGGKKDFWSIYPFLPRETRSYVPIFIAACYAMNYADMYGICPAAEEMTVETDTIMTAERLHLTQISEILGIELKELRRLNPQYARDIVPGGKAYALCIPTDYTEAYITQHDTIYAHKRTQLVENRRAEIELLQKTSVNGAYSVNGVTYYKIKNGDTLSGIASKFRCSVKQLKTWNGLKSDAIRAGHTLKILR